jgi:hypothetical protein
MRLVAARMARVRLSFQLLIARDPMDLMAVPVWASVVRNPMPWVVQRVKSKHALAQTGHWLLDQSLDTHSEVLRA